MKLYYLSGSTIPSRTANSVHVMKMCQAFSEIGHDVTLFSRPGENPLEDCYAFYGVDRTFAIERIRGSRLAGWRALEYAWKIRKYVLSRSLPDLFYARHLFSLLCVANLGRPLIYEAHALPENPIKRLAELRLFLHPNFDRLVVISESLRRDYLDLFPILRSEKIVVAHDGASIPDDNMAESIDWPGRPGHPQVGYVGHLYPGRGIDLIQMLAARLTQVDFHIVGGTEEDLRYWRNRSRQPNLIFHGYVPHGRLGTYMHQFDIVLAPYQRRVALSGGKGDTSRWMSPMKIFEYMSYGKPIIASDLPVLREVLDHGRNAILVDPEDVASWEQSIRDLATNKELAEKIGKQALLDIREKYSWTRRACRVLSGRSDYK